MTESTAPVFRVRLNHGHTLKDGWRLTETTVECTFSGDAGPAEIAEAIHHWTDRAFNLGALEAEERNEAHRLAMAS